MRMSDWSSDVCSSDLSTKWRPAALSVLWTRDRWNGLTFLTLLIPRKQTTLTCSSSYLLPKPVSCSRNATSVCIQRIASSDRKSVVSGKSVSVRLDLGGRRIHKTNNKTKKRHKK